MADDALAAMGRTLTASYAVAHAGRTFEHIHFFVEDKDGSVWFGGGYGQLFRYDGSTLTDFTQKR